MDQQTILKELNEIFKDVLDDDNLVITPDTTASDVEDWDSLNHIQLVVAIEKHFKLRFTSGEITGWKNIGEMAAAIQSKLG